MVEIRALNPSWDVECGHLGTTMGGEHAGNAYPDFAGDGDEAGDSFHPETNVDAKALLDCNAIGGENGNGDFYPEQPGLATSETLTPRPATFLGELVARSSAVF